MSTFEIKKAVRKGTPALISLWGPSGAGKTYTALQIARGLVGPKGRIGMIDTENRRGEFYADLAGGWDHMDLQPPFSPDRYQEAFKAFEYKGGYGCVIVDSVSHVWEGEGGVLDMADKIGGNGLHKWKAPKMAYKRLMNTLLRAPYHIIFCLRARDGIVQKGSGKNATIEKTGIEPICGKGFIYEMTLSALLGGDHTPAFPGPDQPLVCSPLIPAVKAPEDLLHAIKAGEFLGIETGEAIAAWINGGAVFDVDRARLEKTARDVATMGSDRMREYWPKLSVAEQDALKGIVPELQGIAAEADSQDNDSQPPAPDSPFEAPEGPASTDMPTDNPLDDGYTPPPNSPGNGKDKPVSQSASQPVT